MASILIVRSREDHFVLIRQHDHAFLSGTFASKLFPSTKINSQKATLYAIFNHDIGWVDLDKEVVWNEENGEPYTFINYPLAPKVAAYRKGISFVEATYPYAAYLCSKHYTSFFHNATDDLEIQFREGEQKRQERLFSRMSSVEKTNIEANVELLRFCDDLSLALCLNEPGQNSYPWFRDGMGLNDVVYQWEWKDDSIISLVPNLFATSFTVELPFVIMNQSRQRKEEGVYSFRVI